MYKNMINLYDISPPPMVENKKVEVVKCDTCETQKKIIRKNK